MCAVSPFVAMCAFAMELVLGDKRRKQLLNEISTAPREYPRLLVHILLPFLLTRITYTLLFLSLFTLGQPIPNHGAATHGIVA
jgi:hypothetical protein